ncbi:hypothetical protein M2169_006393 [Streptomyces sp. MJP52]|nr:hypothetical protein [Streptomyces sp. MJP52]
MPSYCARSVPGPSVRRPFRSARSWCSSSSKGAERAMRSAGRSRGAGAVVGVFLMLLGPVPSRRRAVFTGGASHARVTAAESGRGSPWSSMRCDRFDRARSAAVLRARAPRAGGENPLAGAEPDGLVRHVVGATADASGRHGGRHHDGHGRRRWGHTHEGGHRRAGGPKKRRVKLRTFPAFPPRLPVSGTETYNLLRSEGFCRSLHDPPYLSPAGRDPGRDGGHCCEADPSVRSGRHHPEGPGEKPSWRLVMTKKPAHLALAMPDAGSLRCPKTPGAPCR